MGLIFRNGKPLIKDGKLSFCEDDCTCKHCPDCCVEITWGTFDSNGDLQVVTTGNTYESSGGPSVTDVTTTYRIIMPTKDSRYVCNNQSIRVEVDYDSADDDVEIVPYTFIKWDFGWKYVTSTGSDPEINQFGLIEWNGPFEIDPIKSEVRSVTLSLDACWLNSVGWAGGTNQPTCPDIGFGAEYPYVSESDVGEIIIGHAGEHEQHIETKHCPSDYWCCPPELECHPCCIYISSDKLLAELSGVDSPQCHHGNPDETGAFVFWDNDGRGSRTRMRVAASTDEPFIRTICPPIEEGGPEFESGPGLQLAIDIVPSDLHPSVLYQNKICIEYDSSIWELAADPDLTESPSCGSIKTVCFPIDDELSRVVNFSLKCREHGEDPILDFTTIEVTVSDESAVDESLRHAELGVIIPFGYCGHMGEVENCCNDEIVCEPCCFAFDSAEGFIDWTVDGGDFVGTFVDCTDPMNPIEVTVSIDLDAGLICMDGSVSITIELSEPEPVPTDLCVAWTGELENPTPTPVVVPGAASVCWPDTDDPGTTYTLGLDLPRKPTAAISIGVTLGDGGGTVYFRSCNAELMPCCVCGEYDYRNCSCGCDFRVSTEPDAELCPDGEGGTITVVGGATQITDFEMALDYVTFPCEGAPVIAITQVGESWQDYTCVNSCIIENIPGDTGVWCPFSVRELHFNWARSPECHPDLPGTGTGTIAPICNPDGSFKEWQVVLFNLGGIGANFTKFIDGDCDSGAESGGFIDAGGVYPGVVNYALTFNITRDYTPACGEEEDFLWI